VVNRRAKTRKGVGIGQTETLGQTETQNSVFDRSVRTG
jgi:hypothetical protein